MQLILSGLFLPGLLLPGAAQAAPCAGEAGIALLEQTIRETSSTLSRAGPDPAAAWERLASLLPCVNAPIPARTAAELHRIAAIASWRADQPERAAASLRAAGQLPPDFPQNLTALLGDPPPPDWRAFARGDGWVQVDGIFATELEIRRAALIQRFSAEGAVLETRYWQPGDDPASLAPLLEPVPVRRAAGWLVLAATGTQWTEPGAAAAGLELRLGVRSGGAAGLLIQAGVQAGGAPGRETGDRAPLPTWTQGVTAGLSLSVQPQGVGLWLGPAWTFQSVRLDRAGDCGEAVAGALLETGCATREQGFLWGPGAEAGATGAAGDRALWSVRAGGFRAGGGWIWSAGLGGGVRW